MRKKKLKQEEDEERNLEELPYECLAHVLLFIHTSALLRLRRVSKIFNNSILNPYSWTSRTLTFFKEVKDKNTKALDSFLKYSQPKKVVGLNILPQFLSGLKRLTVLKLDKANLNCIDMIEMLKRCVCLTTFHVSFEDIFCIEELKSCKNLKFPLKEFRLKDGSNRSISTAKYFPLAQFFLKTTMLEVLRLVGGTQIWGSTIPGHSFLTLLELIFSDAKNLGELEIANFVSQHRDLDRNKLNCLKLGSSSSLLRKFSYSTEFVAMFPQMFIELLKLFPGLKDLKVDPCGGDLVGKFDPKMAPLKKLELVNVDVKCIFGNNSYLVEGMKSSIQMEKVVRFSFSGVLGIYSSMFSLFKNNKVIKSIKSSVWSNDIGDVVFNLNSLESLQVGGTYLLGDPLEWQNLKNLLLLKTFSVRNLVLPHNFVGTLSKCVSLESVTLNTPRFPNSPEISEIIEKGKNSAIGKMEKLKFMEISTGKLDDVWKSVLEDLLRSTPSGVVFKIKVNLMIYSVMKFDPLFGNVTVTRLMNDFGSYFVDLFSLKHKKLTIVLTSGKNEPYFRYSTDAKPKQRAKNEISIVQVFARQDRSHPSTIRIEGLPFKIYFLLNEMLFSSGFSKFEMFFLDENSFDEVAIEGFHELVSSLHKKRLIKKRPPFLVTLWEILGNCVEDYAYGL